VSATSRWKRHRVHNQTTPNFLSENSCSFSDRQLLLVFSSFRPHPTHQGEGRNRRNKNRPFDTDADSNLVNGARRQLGHSACSACQRRLVRCPGYYDAGSPACASNPAEESQSMSATADGIHSSSEFGPSGAGMDDRSAQPRRRRRTALAVAASSGKVSPLAQHPSNDCTRSAVADGLK